MEWPISEEEEDTSRFNNAGKLFFPSIQVFLFSSKLNIQAGYSEPVVWPHKVQQLADKYSKLLLHMTFGSASKAKHW